MKSPITRAQAATAYSNGDQVECGTPCNGHMATWRVVECYTDFDVHSLFRLRPKPMEMWANLHQNGIVTTHMTKRSAIESSVPECRRIAVLLREVTE